MTTLTINQLPSSATVSPTAQLPIMQGGVTSSATVAQINGGAFSVVAYGATGNGIIDDTAAIQAALTAGAGGLVFFPAGSYLVSGPLYISSNTTVAGAGSRIIPSASISSLPTSSNPSLTNTTGPVIFTNVNWQATTITDTNIVIRDLSFGRTSGARIGCHAIFIRMVRNSQVIDCFFERFNDCVAHLACDTTLVERCYAQNYGNAAYDHWDGPVNATVRDCIAVGNQGGVATNAGVFFNIDSNVPGHSSGVGANFLAENVRMWGCSLGIFVGPLITGCTLTNATIRNCYVNQAGVAAPTAPLVYHGVTEGLIDGNMVDTTTASPIFVSIETNSSFPSSRVTISNNTFVNAVVGSSLYIGAYGNYNRVYGNKAISCTAVAGYAIGADDPNTVILENDLAGWTSAYVVNAHPYGGGTTAAMQMDADRVNGSWNFRQGVRLGTNANVLTLDTYEAGTWTPSILFGGAAVGITYGTQAGSYIRLGKLVFLTCDIVLTSKGSSVGNAIIAGVPYNQGGGTSGNGFVTNSYANTSGLTVAPFFSVSGNSTSINVAPGGAAVTDTNFTNTTTLRYSGTYRLA